MLFLLYLRRVSSFISNCISNDSPDSIQVQKIEDSPLEPTKCQTSVTSLDLFDHICEHRFMLLFKSFVIIDMLRIHGIPQTTLSISNGCRWVTLNAFQAVSSLKSNTSFQYSTPFNVWGRPVNASPSSSRSGDEILFSRSFRVERGVCEPSQEFPKSEIWQRLYQFVSSLG